MRAIRRFLILSGLCMGLVTSVASPGWAQVERVYVGVSPPAAGAVLGASNQSSPGAAGTNQGSAGFAGSTRSPAVASPGTQALPFQVSSGPVAAATQAPVRGLALTGTDVASLVLIALLALAVGIVLTRGARSRPLPKS